RPDPVPALANRELCRVPPAPRRAWGSSDTASRSTADSVAQVGGRKAVAPAFPRRSSRRTSTIAAASAGTPRGSLAIRHCSTPPGAVQSDQGENQRSGNNALRRFPTLRCRSEEHTSELQSLAYLVCRLLLEK